VCAEVWIILYITKVYNALCKDEDDKFSNQAIQMDEMDSHKIANASDTVPVPFDQTFYKSLGTLIELKKYEAEGTPIGTELCGSLYRPGAPSRELRIEKEYGGRNRSGTIAVTCSFDLPLFWMTPEWCHDPTFSKSWIDEEVVAEVGMELATAVRARVLAASDPEELEEYGAMGNCADVGYVVPDRDDPRSDAVFGGGGRGVHRATEGGHAPIESGWFRTAVMRRVPEVLDMCGTYVLVDVESAVAEPIEIAVRVVDRIFDLCGEKRPHSLTLQLLKPALRDVAMAYARIDGADEALWGRQTESVRTWILRTAREWRAERARMTAKQRLEDDRENYVTYDHLSSMLKTVNAIF
jgi:hypothetical protein